MQQTRVKLQLPLLSLANGIVLVFKYVCVKFGEIRVQTGQCSMFIVKQARADEKFEKRKGKMRKKVERL